MQTRRAAYALTMLLILVVLIVKEGSNAVLPIALPALQHVSASGRRITSMAPGIGAIGYAAGKLSVMLLTHALGPRVILSSSCALNAVGMAVCAIGGAEWLPIGWATSQFAAAHVWVACVALCSTWVSSGQRGRTLGIIMGAGSDGGGILASLGFSFIFDVYGPSGWRLPFVIEGWLLAFTAVTIVGVLSNSPEESGFEPAEDEGQPPSPDTKLATTREHPLATASFSDALRSFGSDCRIWLMLVACTAYAVETSITTVFAPAYASGQLGASDGESARLLSFVMAGHMAGDLVGGFVKDSLRGRAMLTATLVIKALGVGFAAAWVALDRRLTAVGPPATTSPAALVTLVGVLLLAVQLTVTYSWNVVLSSFVLHAGGPRHAATLAGVLDCVSFAARIPLSFVVGACAADAQWSAVPSLLVLFVLAGHGCMAVFVAIIELSEPMHGKARSPSPSPSSRGPLLSRTAGRELV